MKPAGTLMKRPVILVLAAILASWAAAAPAAGPRPWTVMVLHAGPSAADPAIDGFFRELSEGASDEVNVLLATNYPVRADQPDFKGYYHLVGGEPARFETAQAVPALDPATPEALSAFLEYARANRPAERYALVLADHGASPGAGNLLDGVLHDVQSGKVLHLADGTGLVPVLDQWRLASGCPLDLLCLAGPGRLHWENALALGDRALRLTGLEDPASGTLPGLGAWLSQIAVDHLDRDQAAVRLAQIASNEGAKGATALDLQAFPPLGSGIHTLAMKLLLVRAGGQADALGGLRASLPTLASTDGLEFTDLGRLLDQLVTGGCGAPAAQTAQSLKSLWAGAVLAHFPDPGSPSTTGLAIYYPAAPSDYKTLYDGTVAAATTIWDSFVKGLSLLEPGDHLLMSSTNGVNLKLGDEDPVLVDAVVQALDAEADEIRFGGSITFGTTGSLSFSGLALRLSTLVDSGSVQVVRHPVVTGCIPSAALGPFTVENVTATWDGKGFHLWGALRVDNLALAGTSVGLNATLALTVGADGSVKLGALQLEDVTVSKGAFLLTGSGSIEPDPYRVRFSGQAQFGAPVEASLSVTDFVATLDGQVLSYGTTQFTAGNLSWGHLAVSGVTVSWNGQEIAFGGTLSISGVSFLGAAAGFSGTVTGAFGLASGTPALTRLEAPAITAGVGDVSLSGSALFQNTPDRLSISGTLSAGSVGTFTLAGLEVGLDGTIHSAGTLTWTGQEIHLRALTLSNLQVSLDSQWIALSGTFRVGGVPIFGKTWAIEGHGGIRLGIRSGKLDITGFDIDSVTVSDGSQGKAVLNAGLFNGAVTWDEATRCLVINGPFQIPNLGTLTVTGFMLQLDGTVVQYGSWDFTGDELVLGGLTILNPQVIVSNTWFGVYGTAQIDNLNLLGNSFQLKGTVNLTASLAGGSPSITTLALTGVTLAGPGMTFTGSAAWDGAAQTLTLTGGATFNSLGTFSVSGFKIKPDGTVVSYGTWSYQSAILTLGGLKVLNPQVTVSDQGLSAQGTLSLPNVSLLGAAWTFNGAVSLTASFTGGTCTLTSLSVNGISATYGNLSFTGGAAYSAGNPGTLTLNGTLQTPSYGNFQVSNLVINTNGQVVSCGTISYNAPQINLSGATLSNLAITLTGSGLTVGGTLSVGNIGIAGGACSFSTTATASFSVSSGTLKLVSLAVSDVSFGGNGFSFTGSLSWNGVTQRLLFSGNFSFSDLFSGSVTGLEMGLDGTVYTFGSLAASVSQVTVNGFTLQNFSLLLTSQQLTLKAAVSASGIPLAGGSLSFSAQATAVFKVTTSGLGFQSLSIDQVNFQSAFFSLSGGVTILSSPTRLKMNGTITIPGYGSLAVTGLEIGLDGKVYSYGSVACTLPSLTIGGFTLSNLTVGWNGTALSIGGSIGIGNIPIGGSKASFSLGGTASFTYQTSSGWSLASFNNLTLSGGVGNFTVTGTGTVIPALSCVEITGKFTFGSYGALTVSGLRVRQNGSILSYGQVAGNLSNLKVGAVTFSNITAGLSGSQASVSGTVALDTTSVDLSASGQVSLTIANGAVKVNTFNLTGLSGSFNGFSFSGSAVYLSASGAFDISGSVALTQAFNASLQHLVVTTQGTVLSVQAVTAGLKIGGYSFGGSVKFPAAGQVEIAGSFGMPSFLSGSAAGGSIKLKKHPGGGVLGSGWDVLAGSISIPSFKIGGYSFGGANFTCDQTHVAGGAKLSIPAMATVEFSFDIGWNGQFNGACLIASGMKIPLASTGLFLAGAGGCIYHHTTPSDYWEIMLTGTVTDATGMLGIKAVLEVETTGHIVGTGTVLVSNYPFSSAQVDINIPAKQVGFSAWLGQDPNTGIGAYGCYIQGRLGATFNWGGPWVIGSGHVGLEVFGFDFLGVSAAFGVNYPYYPYSYGSYSCEKLRGSGVSAAGEMWWGCAYGGTICRTGSGWDVDLFSCCD
ncbi:MAG: hypothetical protein KA419_10470 [Acidobacteria bacterium]|nr:hypothetical protein [Acidobacteriota bacterium]